jgi:hypothetical protein
MITKCVRLGLTKIELIVLIAVIGLVILLVQPFIQRSRELNRQATCRERMKKLDLNFANYASTFNNAYPAAGELIKPADGNSPYKIGGYSCLVKTLPFWDSDATYMQLPKDLPGGSVVLAGTNSSLPQSSFLARTMDVSFRDFVCPSNGNWHFQQPHANPPKYALTNYKAVGASCAASLAFAGDPKAKPPYGKAEMHPDGAIYPSDKNIPASSIHDGLSRTIFLIETIDDTNSRWMIGSECVLTGLPRNAVPSGPDPDPKYRYFVPPHFDGKFGAGSGVMESGLQDFMMYDFSPSSPEVGAYSAEGDPGGMNLWTVVDPPLIREQGGVKINGPAYGPSSAHAGVITVGFGDASVRSLSRQCDPTAFFFMITKNNSDPFELP